MGSRSQVHSQFGDARAGGAGAPGLFAGYDARGEGLLRTRACGEGARREARCKSRSWYGREPALIEKADERRVIGRGWGLAGDAPCRLPPVRHARGTVDGASARTSFAARRRSRSSFAGEDLHSNANLNSSPHAVRVPCRRRTRWGCPNLAAGHGQALRRNRRAPPPSVDQ